MLFTPKQINQQEVLDDPNIAIEIRKKLLCELDRANQIFGIYKIGVRKLFKFIDSHMSHLKDIRLLEIGSGSGGLAREILRYNRGRLKISYHMMDIDSDILEWAKQNLSQNGFQISTHVAGPSHLKQFQSGAFDIIISLNVIHHIQPKEIVQDLFQDLQDKSTAGFWMADLERRPMNGLIHLLANQIGRIDKTVAEDGRRSLNRAYTLDELIDCLPDSTDWNHYPDRFWWNPYMIVAGVRK